MSHNNDFSRLFSQLESLSVGFGPVFKDFQIQTSTYPPHNIVKLSDEEFFIEIALAGFKREEIKMEEHQGLLTITGDKSVDAPIASAHYQHRGIAARSFSKSFRIAEFFEVSSAVLEDGMLTVYFVKNIPDEAKPKLITIG